MDKTNAKQRNCERALLRYYKKRYGDQAEEMMRINKEKKLNSATAHAGRGRPATQTKEEYRKKQRQASLKCYYVKKYGAEKAESVAQLNALKKTLV